MFAFLRRIAAWFVARSVTPIEPPTSQRPIGAGRVQFAISANELSAADGELVQAVYRETLRAHRHEADGCQVAARVAVDYASQLARSARKARRAARPQQQPWRVA